MYFTKNKISNFFGKNIIFKFCQNAWDILTPKGIICSGDILDKNTAFFNHPNSRLEERV